MRAGRLAREIAAVVDRNDVIALAHVALGEPAERHRRAVGRMGMPGGRAMDRRDVRRQFQGLADAERGRTVEDRLDPRASRIPVGLAPTEFLSSI